MTPRFRFALWCLPALLPALLVGGLAVAQGYQPNFIRNFIGPIFVTGDQTVTGTVAASTVKALVVDAGTLYSTGPLTAIGKSTFAGVNAGDVVLDGGARLLFNAATTHVESDGAGGVAGAWGAGANFTGNYSTSGNIVLDGTLTVKSDLRNSATAANCTGTGAVCVNDTGGLEVTNGSGTTTAAITAAGLHTSAATSGNQFACTGAGTCNIQSASGQTAALDCGGGTCTASICATNATTCEAGRSGQTMNINGNVTFGTAGPNLGGTVTGAWNVTVAGTVAHNTDYGAFYVASSATNAKFREVACWSATGSGVGDANFVIRNVTDGTNLCNGTLNCALSVGVAVFDCNQTPLAGKVYALRQTEACDTTAVTDLECNVEIAH